MRRFILGVGASMLVACGGPDHAAICEEAEGCSGGNDKDVDACIIRLDAMADIADEEGCGSEYDDYVTCIEEKAKCDLQDSKVPCDTQDDCGFSSNATCSGNVCKLKQFGLSSEDDCEEERNAFERCSDIGLDID